MKLRRRIASRDFTADMMPQTRKAVFIDVLKLHWSTFLKMGLLLFVAYLPVLCTGFLQNVYEIRALGDLGGNATLEDVQKVLLDIVFLRSVSAIITTAFLTLFGVFLSGVLRVIRQFAWEEIVFFWRDIWTGIKQNKGQLAAIFAVIGMQNLVSIYLTGTGQVTANQSMSLLGTIFAGTSILLFAPVWAFMCVQISIYSNSFLQNMKLGFAVYAKSIVKTILTLAVLALPWIISLIPNVWYQLIGQVVGVFLLPIALLAWFLYAFNLLDQHINPAFFPEIIGKGLYKAELTTEETLRKKEINNNEKEDPCD